MYGLENEKISRLVSANIEDVMLTIFGSTDANGHFTDKNRLYTFFKKDEVFSKLIDGNVVIENNGHTENISWVEILKNRCEDILAKIQDQQTMYEFNTFGEGIIAEIVRHFTLYSETLPYLSEYIDNKDKFDESHKYIPLINRNETLKILAEFTLPYYLETYRETFTYKTSNNMKDFICFATAKIRMMALTNPEFYSPCVYDIISDKMHETIDLILSRCPWAIPEKELRQYLDFIEQGVVHEGTLLTNPASYLYITELSDTSDTSKLFDFTDRHFRINSILEKGEI